MQETHTYKPISRHIADADFEKATHTHIGAHESFHSCCIPCFICSLLFITLHFTPQSLGQIKGCLLLYARAYSTPKSLYGIWLLSKGNMKWNIWQCWSEQTLIKASPEATHLLLPKQKLCTKVTLVRAKILSYFLYLEKLACFKCYKCSI